MERKTEMLRFNPYDFDGMVKIMDEFGDREELLFGENEDGESTTMSVSPDHITVVTLQSNGWTRTNVYWRDGTTEELYNR